MKWLLLLALAVVAGSCTPDLTPPLNYGSANNMAAYFWSAGASLAFDSDQVTVRDSSGLLIATDVDKSNRTHTLVCKASADTVYASGFAPNSILDLDDGWFFSALDTVTISHHALTTAVVNKDDGFDVGTDSSLYEGTKSGGFTPDKFSPLNITTLAVVPNSDSLFAVTGGNAIWLRHAGNWTSFSTVGLPTGAIIAMTADPSSLYVAISGAVGIYQFSRSSTSWKLLPGFMALKHVTALKAFVHFGVSEYLMAGADDGTVGGNASNTANNFTANVSGRVNSFAGDANGAMGIAAEGGVYKMSGPTVTPVVLDSRPASSIAFTSGGFFMITGGSVYAVGTSPGVTTGYTGIPHTLLMASGNAFLVTDSAIYYFSTTWNPLPGFPFSYYPTKYGGLVLLRSNPLVDSSWRAGTLVDPNHHSYAITARTISRFDTVTVGSQVYRDVIVMRYAHELAGFSADSINAPYWVVFYERGLGPVIFDRMRKGEALLRRKYLGQ